MSQQYPSSAPYGYPPHYPSFTHVPSSQAPYPLLNSAQAPSHVANHSYQNARSFDKNSQTQPNIAPFLPPGFNPELLMHLPPPPPPPPNFASGTNTPTSYAHFQQAMTSATHSFPPSLHSHTPSFALNAATDFGNRTPEQVRPEAQLSTANSRFEQSYPGKNSLQEAGRSHHDFPTGQPMQREAAVGQSISHSMQPTHSMHISDAQISSRLAGRQTRQGAAGGLPTNSESQQEPNPSSKPSSRAELRERAKAAVLELAPHDISYESLLAEGINSQVLQQLFDELGLERATQKPSSNSADSCQISTSEPAPPVEEQNKSALVSSQASLAAANTGAKLSSGASRSSPVISPSIERKDRIAQLLAARTGKTSTISTSSQPASPHSNRESTPQPVSIVETSATIPAQNVAIAKNKILDQEIANQKEVIRQKAERTSTEAVENSKLITTVTPVSSSATPNDRLNQTTIPQSHSMTLAQLAPLSTPVRDKLIQNGSSMIPGLFMTSDEEELISNLGMNTEGLANAVPGTLIPRKRSGPSDPSADRDNSKAKRTATFRPEVGNESAVIPEQSLADDGSEGETSSEVDFIAAARSTHAALPATNQPSLQVHTDLPDDGSARHRASAMADTSPHEGQHTLPQSNVDTVHPLFPGTRQRQMEENKRDAITSPAESTPINSVITQIATASPTSVEEQTRVAASKPLIPLAKLNQAQLAERTAQLKANIQRQQELRRQQLLEGIPALREEIQSTQNSLQQAKARHNQVRKEVERHESAIARALEEERRLLGDIDHLERQLRSSESGQRQFSNELKDMKQQNELEQKATASLALSSSNQESVVMDSIEPSGNSASKGLQVPLDGAQNGGTAITDEAGFTMIQDSVTQGVDHDATTNSTDPSEETFQTPPRQTEEHQTPASVAATEPVEATSHKIDDDEPMEQSENESDEDSHMSIDDLGRIDESNDSNNEDANDDLDDDLDSVSMSGSGSEDYEPAEAEYAVQRVASEEYEPTDNVSPTTDMNLASGGEYEPAKDGQLVEATSSLPTLIEPSGIEGAEALPSGKYIQDPEYQSSEPMSTVSTNAPNMPLNDQELALELTEPNMLTKQQDILQSAGESIVVFAGDTSPSTHFVPYRSPLSSLKSFRFHPMFNDQVRSGYRSLTYSNKIDAKQPICKTELSGQPCTDPSCEEQHFESMALSDDRILVQMSSANDIKDKTLRDEYIIGLKKVITRLRLENVKEFSAVAQALANYRREFMDANMGI